MTRALALLVLMAAGLASLSPGRAQEEAPESPAVVEEDAAGTDQEELPAMSEDPENDLTAGPAVDPDANIGTEEIQGAATAPPEALENEVGEDQFADDEAFAPADGSPETEQPASGEAAGSGETAPSAPNPYFDATLETLTATRTAPLFTPSRTPPDIADPEPVSTEVAEAPDDTDSGPPALVLTGIVVAGTEEVAILTDQSSGEVTRLRPGEDVEGWTMRIVDGRSVEFSSGDEKHTLTMFTEYPDGPVSPPTPDSRDDSEDEEEFYEEDSDDG